MIVYVNHKVLKSRKDLLNTRVKTLVTLGQGLGEIIDDVSINWVGKDSDTFKKVGQKLVGNDKADLEYVISGVGNYANFIEFAANEYFSVHKRAIERARKV